MDMLYHPGSWGNPQAMSKVLRSIKSVFDDPTGGLPQRSIAKVLLAYRKTAILPSFLELKYACFGVGQSIDDWQLLADPELFSKLLNTVDRLHEEPRRLRKCYQGLLAGYFSYRRQTGHTANNGQKNFELLREALGRWLPIVNLGDWLKFPRPTWLETLLAHDNLLRRNPCDRYAEQLLHGGINELQQTFQALGIARDSWLWEEALRAQVKTVCAWDDERFQASLVQLLAMIQAEDETVIAEPLAIRCIAILLVRYASCAHKPEHAALRDAANQRIGNPWLKRVAWDAFVRTVDGKPHDEARKMVGIWLERRGAGRFTDTGNGTWMDNQTGLIWLKNIHCMGQKPWPDALEDVKYLANKHCGLKDGSKAGEWRLPSKDELEGLIDGFSRPAIFQATSKGKRLEDHAFANKSSCYWSSTPLAGSSSYVWAANFHGEQKVGCFDELSSFYSWPVRGKGWGKSRKKRRR